MFSLELAYSSRHFEKITRYSIKSSPYCFLLALEFPLFNTHYCHLNFIFLILWYYVLLPWSVCSVMIDISSYENFMHNRSEVVLMVSALLLS